MKKSATFKKKFECLIKVKVNYWETKIHSKC